MHHYMPDPDCNITVHATGRNPREPGVKPLYHYALFNKSPMQLREIGALGGKAYGRNQRARRALMPTQPETAPPRATLAQSTAEAVAVLDAQFPWLRGVEQRRSRNQPSRWLQAHSPRCVKRSE